MKKSLYHTLFLLCLLAVSPELLAQGIYRGAPVPQPLLEKAHAVIRRDETVFTVNGVNNATKRVFKAITVLDEKGKDEAVLAVLYDKLVKVESLKGTLYDALGNEIQTLKKSDIQDRSAISNYSLYEDNRYKLAAFNYQNYPYTVQFEYELHYKGLMFYPTWVPQPDPEVPVESSKLVIVSLPSLPVRYKELNLEKGQAVTQSAYGSYLSYTWEAASLPVRKTEPFSRLSDYLPRVHTSPATFEIEGYSGSMNTWQELGLWIAKLNAGRQALPESTRAKVREILDSTPDDIERIRKIYEYLQETTRYVSIQLGIGGWQPFTATQVATNGYGDCKALSNYMHAMLQEAGITSHYTLVRAGKREPNINTDFPSPGFNHAILCVPLKADTVWLECTSQTESFGYQGSFTGNRDVLLITPEGGKLAHTRVYKKMDNQMLRTAEVFVRETGDATASVTTVYTGLQQETRSDVAQQTPDDQKKWLYNDLEIANFDIREFSLQRQRARVPAVTEKLKLDLRQLASKSGKRLFLAPNLLSRWTYVPEELTDRKTDIDMDYPYYDSDTIRYHLPEGYHIEYKPEDVKFQSRFGEYHVTVKAEGNLVTYIRTVSMNGGRHPKAAYSELVEFLKNIVKADKTKLVLVSST